MKRVFGIVMIVALTFFAPHRVLAQAYGTELPFVLGTDARISGMGLAGVSLRGDASIQYYNPAGMSYLEWRQFAFFRSVLFDSDALYHTASYSHPLLNYGTLGISILRLDVGGVEERDDSNQLSSQDLHNSQTRILLGYSKHITSAIAAGFNIKIDNQSFGTFSGSGVGLDVGIAASQHMTSHAFIRGFRQGFAIQNLLEPAVKLEQEKVADPMQVAFGVSVLSGFGSAFMATTIDLVSPRFSPVRLHLGQEITYANSLSLRFGVDENSPTYGLGAEYKSAALDYAYRSTDVGGNHQFSVSFRFGSSIAQQKNKARARLERQVNDEINLRMDELERSQITSALHEGDSLFARGDYDRASTRFESALLWDPGNNHAEEYLTRSKYQQLIGQGAAAIGQEDYIQGLFYSKQALELIPNDPEATTMVSLCNEKIRESRNSAELVNNLLKASIDLYADRQFAKALSGFQELVRLDPTSPLANEYRRKCLMQINEAVQKHLRASRQAAQSADYDAAIEELERVLAYRPNDSAIKKRIGELKHKRQDASEMPPAAVVPAAHPTVTTPSTANASELEDKYKRGMQHFNKGQFDKAVGLFMEVWTANPNFHDVGKLLTKSYLLIGMRLYSRDDYAAAIDVWKKALAIDPDNLKVKRYLSRTDAEFRKSKVYGD